MTLDITPSCSSIHSGKICLSPSLPDDTQSRYLCAPQGHKIKEEGQNKLVSPRTHILLHATERGEPLQQHSSS